MVGSVPWLHILLGPYWCVCVCVVHCSEWACSLILRKLFLKFFWLEDKNPTFRPNLRAYLSFCTAFLRRRLSVPRWDALKNTNRNSKISRYIFWFIAIFTVIPCLSRCSLPKPREKWRFLNNWPPCPPKQHFSTYIFSFLCRNVVTGAVSFFPSIPWISCSMAERPVGIVERIGCSHPLKGPSEFFFF